MILLLMAGATIFGYFMMVSRIPFEIVGYVQSLHLSPVTVIAMVCITWFIFGCFTDAMALMLLLLPLVYPLVVDIGYDPIWFGVLVNALGIIAIVTPPVGTNAYVTQGVARGVPLETVFRGYSP